MSEIFRLFRNSRGMRHFLSFPRRRETMFDRQLCSFRDEIPAYAGMTTTAIPVELIFHDRLPACFRFHTRTMLRFSRRNDNTP